MIRFVLIALAVIAVWFLLLKLFGEMRKSNIDWTGVAVVVGFVVLAFYLRSATGL